MLTDESRGLWKEVNDSAGEAARGVGNKLHRGRVLESDISSIVQVALEIDGFYIQNQMVDEPIADAKKSHSF